MQAVKDQAGDEISNDERSYAHSRDGTAINNNIIGISEESAARIAAALTRSGLITGAVGAAAFVVLFWTITAINKDETAHTLCAYEFNRFTAQVEAGKDISLIASQLAASGCNTNK